MEKNNKENHHPVIIIDKMVGENNPVVMAATGSRKCLGESLF